MRAAGIRNQQVVVVRNLAKSEHRNFASISPSVKDSRAVRSSVLVSDSDSVSKLSDSAKRRQEPELIKAYFWGFPVVPHDGLCCCLIQKMKRLRKTLTQSNFRPAHRT
jgi:hypothetical protein